jgi:hypothetical protein
MTSLAFYDSETNGLLDAKVEKGVVENAPDGRVHGIAILIQDQARPRSARPISPATRRGTGPGLGADGDRGRLRILEQADMRVAFNGQDFRRGRDPPRAIPPGLPVVEAQAGKLIDPLLLSRLIYPDIAKSGPNSTSSLPS